MGRVEGYFISGLSLVLSLLFSAYAHEIRQVISTGGRGWLLTRKLLLEIHLHYATRMHEDLSYLVAWFGIRIFSMLLWLTLALAFSSWPSWPSRPAVHPVKSVFFGLAISEIIEGLVTFNRVASYRRHASRTQKRIAHIEAKIARRLPSNSTN